MYGNQCIMVQSTKSDQPFSFSSQADYLASLSEVQRLDLGKASLVQTRLEDIAVKLERAIAIFTSSLDLDLASLDDAFFLQDEDEVERIWTDVEEAIEKNYLGGIDYC